MQGFAPRNNYFFCRLLKYYHVRWYFKAVDPNTGHLTDFLSTFRTNGPFYTGQGCFTALPRPQQGGDQGAPDVCFELFQIRRFVNHRINLPMKIRNVNPNFHESVIPWQVGQTWPIHLRLKPYLHVEVPAFAGVASRRQA